MGCSNSKIEEMTTIQARSLSPSKTNLQKQKTIIKEKTLIEAPIIQFEDNRLKNEEAKSSNNEASTFVNNSLLSQIASHLYKRSIKPKTVFIPSNDEPADKIKLNENKQLSSYANTTNKIKIILERIRKIINDNEVEKEINILVLDSLYAYKDENSSFKVFDKIKFSLLKLSKEINWNRKPYSKVQTGIEEYFNDNNLSEFYGFDWGSNLLEYEKNYIDLNLKKSYEDGSFKNFSFSVAEKYEKPNLIIFINPNDRFVIQKLKEIHNLPEKNFNFIPIYGERVSGKKDAVFKKEFLSSMGLSDIPLCFLPVDKNNDSKTKLEKYINFTSNDNNNTLNSVCLIIDSDGFVRYSGVPSNLCIDSLFHMEGNIGYSKLEAKKIKEDLKNYFENFHKEAKDNLFRGFIKFNTAKIYSSNPSTGKLFALMEPVIVNNYYADNEDKIIKDLTDKLGNYLSVSVNSIMDIKLEDTSDVLIKEMNKIKENNELENINFTMILEVKKRFNSITNREFNLKTEKNKSSNLILHLPCESVEAFSSFLEQLNVVRTFPLINKINYISVAPKIESVFPETLVLYNTSTSSQEEVNLLDEKPKFILVIGYNKTQEEREELVLKLNKIWEDFSSDEELLNNITLLIIFKGESLNEANELLAEEIFKSNESSIYLLNPNISTNFPLTFDNFSFENLSSQLNCILLDSDNTVRYVGNAEEIDLTHSINHLIEGKTNIEYKNIFPITQDYMKTNIKKEFSKFLSLIKKLLDEEQQTFYRPLVELSFHKICDFENEELTEINYKNLKMKIIYKDVNKFLEDKTIKKYFDKFENKYQGTIKTVEIKTCKLKINADLNCFICKIKCTRDAAVEFFYNQENENSMCRQCETKINPQFRDINLIHCKYKEANSSITEEIIEDHLKTNISSGSFLDVVESPLCSLCSDDLTNHQVIWMSMIHVNKSDEIGLSETDPVLVCDGKCYERIFYKPDEGMYLEKEQRKMKILGIDKNNFIMRKITLPSMTGFN